jgi:hypothetical protein
MKTTLQNLREHDQVSWVLIVDIVRAYDTINLKMLWRILTILGVPESLIEVLKKLYKDITINLRVGEKLEQFLSTSGVKQGGNLASILFSSFTQYPILLTRNGKSQLLALEGIWTLKLEENREGSYAEPRI